MSSLTRPQEEEDCTWNQRKLDSSMFDRLPAMNPLLTEFPGMANGICNVTVDDTPLEAGIDGRTQRLKTKCAMAKEEFEDKLIPLVLLALDGVLYAIESLETSSSILKAAALHKLLTKITK